MSKTAPATVICEICKKPKSPHDGMLAELIRPSLLEFIKKRLPGWDGNGFICLGDLGNFRKDYVKEVLQEEIGALSALKMITRSISKRSWRLDTCTKRSITCCDANTIGSSKFSRFKSSCSKNSVANARGENCG